MGWSSLFILAAVWIAFWVYVAVTDDSPCNGDCNQGRDCDCKTLR
jgi:hypothetical protein